MKFYYFICFINTWIMMLISVTISGYEAEGIIVVLLKLTKIRRLGFFVFEVSPTESKKSEKASTRRRHTKPSPTKVKSVLQFILTVGDETQCGQISDAIP